jgi:hypothetical protein
MGTGPFRTGDAEQPAAERLDRPAEARQRLDRGGEHLGGEVLGGVPVAQLRDEEAEQRRRVGGVEAGDGRRLAAAGGGQVELRQLDAVGLPRALLPCVLAPCEPRQPSPPDPATAMRGRRLADLPVDRLTSEKNAKRV